LKVSADQVNEHVSKLAKKGLTPSQIGVILRDSHGIGQVRNVTGSKILRILKANGTSRFYFTKFFTSGVRVIIFCGLDELACVSLSLRPAISYSTFVFIVWHLCFYL